MKKGRILFKNAQIITMDQKNTIVNSLAIENDRIAALGSFTELSGLQERGVEILDLKGMTVVPGFIDSHVHLLNTGIRPQQLELEGTRSFDEIVDKIRMWDKEHPREGWICGWGIDDTKLKEGHMPEAKDLDRAEVNRPVWVSREDGNSSAVNTQGLGEIDFSLDDFSVIKDESGKPMGLFKVPSHFVIRSQILNRLGLEVKKKSLEWAAGSALRKGVTTVHSMEYLEDIATMRETFNKLPIRVDLFARSDNLDGVLKLGLKTIGGDVLLDGTFGCHTAAISTPYADNPQEKGVLYYEKKKESLLELMKRAQTAGLQSAFHAMGDRAIEMALDIFEAVLKEKSELPIKHRIEHYELPTPDQIRRTAKLGLFVSMSPANIYFYCGEKGAYLKRLGAERIKKVLPFKEILHQGVVVGGNSDSPISEMNPLLGVYAAVNAPFESQRIKLKEAMEIFTINGAKLAHKEDEVGSIEVGKHADLVVLKENPFDISLNKIKDIEIVITFVGGEIKFEGFKTHNP